MNETNGNGRLTQLVTRAGHEHKTEIEYAFHREARRTDRYCSLFWFSLCVNLALGFYIWLTN